MNLNCPGPVTQTCDMNQYFNYGLQETPNNNDCASFQQSQDLYMYRYMYTNNDQPAAVVPRLPCPNKLESCAQPDNVFPKQENISGNSFAGLSYNSVQILDMQHYITENQAAVVPSSDSNNIPMLTDAGFHIANGVPSIKSRNYQTQFAPQKISDMQDYLTENQTAVVPSSDSNNIPMLNDAGFHIANGVPSIKSRNYQTQFAPPKNILSTNLSLQGGSSTVSNVPQLKPEQTAQRQQEKYVEHVHEVPIAPKRRKPRKPKKLEKFNGNGVPLLWQFILQLLISNTGDMCWTHRAPFEFKIVNPDNVAHQWGKAKGKKNMTYEKLSRSIRYYYRKNIISKDDRKQHVYRFVCNIVEILGYDPTVCPPKSGNSIASQNNTEETPKPCSTEIDEKNIRSTQAHVNTDQGIPCSFTKKTEVDANGNSGDLFAFGEAEMVPNETIFPPDESAEIDVNEILFPSEYLPISDTFFFSDNDLETQQLDDCQFPSFDAFSF